MMVVLLIKSVVFRMYDVIVFIIDGNGIICRKDWYIFFNVIIGIIYNFISKFVKFKFVINRYGGVWSDFKGLC